MPSVSRRRHALERVDVLLDMGQSTRGVFHCPKHVSQKARCLQGRMSWVGWRSRQPTQLCRPSMIASRRATSDCSRLLSSARRLLSPVASLTSSTSFSFIPLSLSTSLSSSLTRPTSMSVALTRRVSYTRAVFCALSSMRWRMAWMASTGAFGDRASSSDASVSGWFALSSLICSSASTRRFSAPCFSSKHLLYLSLMSVAYCLSRSFSRICCFSCDWLVA
mmetsp:Transcript_34645/g.99719  ORF Transcript_34645/g.99719 Transcript_34645/m.99719 type:complete len:221 (-) Transcript_34645:93-755(-)